MFEIRRAQGADHPAIRHLLSLTPVGEPTHPLREEDVLYVAETDGTLIGISGLAPCAPHLGLFHSLLVRPGYRKRHIARQLYQRVMDHAYDLGIRELYTLTASGRTYFETLGFLPAPQNPPPPPLQRLLHDASYEPGQTALLVRSLARQGDSAPPRPAPGRDEDPGLAAARHFDQGYYCAESVLLALSHHLGRDDPLIPRIATGFCTGQSRSWGTCGALSGAIMALGLELGRSDPQASASPAYQAVQRLTREFGQACGGTRCSELLGCDLDTEDGRQVYCRTQAHAQCREYVSLAARLAVQIMATSPATDPNGSLF